MLLGLWAEPPPVDLRWDGVCRAPDVVLHRLGEELEDAAGAASWVHVDASVVAAEAVSGVVATVSLETEAGQTERRLEAERCDALHEAIALVLAIHVDPYGGAGSPEATAPPEPEPEPQSALVPEAAPEPKTTPGVAPPPRRSQQPTPVQPRADDPAGPGTFFVQAGVGVSADVQPQAAPAFELSGGWARVRLRFDARATYRPPQRDTFDSAMLSFQSWDLAGRGCVRFFPGPVTLPVCGVVGAGAVNGAARGVVEEGRDARALLYVAASVGAQWMVAPRLGFWAQVEGGATLLRPRFAVEGLGTVHTANVLRLGASMGVRFDFL